MATAKGRWVTINGRHVFVGGGGGGKSHAENRAASSEALHGLFAAHAKLGLPVKVTHQGGVAGGGSSAASHPSHASNLAKARSLAAIRGHASKIKSPADRASYYDKHGI